MSQNLNSPTETSQIMDVNFEEKLLASVLVTEVRKGKGNVSLTLTDTGVVAFAKAFLQAMKEEVSVANNSSKKLYPGNDPEMISKKDIMEGLGISHTTLWKWQKLGYLVPVKVGRKVYYRRADIIKLTDKA